MSIAMGGGSNVSRLILLFDHSAQHANNARSRSVQVSEETQPLVHLAKQDRSARVETPVPTAKPGVESACLLLEASPDRPRRPRVLAQSRQHAVLRALLSGEEMLTQPIVDVLTC